MLYTFFPTSWSWPIKAKFHVEPPWEGATKVCINGPGYMTKMLKCLYGKNLKKIFRTKSPMILKLAMGHQGFNLYKVYINDGPG